MRRIFRIIIDELTIRTEEPFVMRSQIGALTTQLPLLYASLCTNALALAYTHFHLAPDFLTLVVPAILVPICFVRVIIWRRMDIAKLTDQRVRYQLQRTVILVAVLGVAFSAWAQSLFAYGGPYEQAHVLFFMAITVVGCIFCLIHLRPAALLLTAIVIPTFVIRFAATGHPVLVALAINVLIVTIVMTAMMLAYYQDFRRLVHSTQLLARMGEDHRRAAQVDALTGLANRRRFFQDLDVAISGVEQEGVPFALALIDLDGFKPVNDLYGHQAGDLVLCEVGRRLVAGLGGNLIIARLGGDEFGLLVTGADEGAPLETIGRTVCDLVAQPISVTHASVKVTASVGFAICAGPGRSPEQLFERADFALYHAKDHCRGTAVIFNEEHALEIRARRQLEHELQRADMDAEMWLAFQPIVNVDQAHIFAFEALARWTSPVLGSVSPGAFIPAAERLGLVKDLTRILFRKACAAALDWPDDVRLSFNLSVEDLADAESGIRLIAMVRQCGLPPNRLIFEITETAVMRDFDRASTVLAALRALGCSIALDDFGTGYSSLSYVNRLPLDKLKIDQSFVRSLGIERSSRTIIESICDLSKNLSIGCVVEGVETREQVEILRSIGCFKMQGYYFGRPMPAAAVLAHLSQERRPVMTVA
ncbi:putative bifunctional diguanylate cyclase/phosphodiesterase [Lichenifustis flavocetrariae]|uniref:EAL domain-containing protein n=1 Tax=Lichenifustis flavocetrariae TaxID=2949735 RepID=A0AA42CM06_9HYPH|nr:EAL domain-containing protein [Lichenifustis flavocetrariae]MCW6507865.1 EAL domain-containing protein [Lichenifustis flavocetrariae]